MRLAAYLPFVRGGALNLKIRRRSSRPMIRISKIKHPSFSHDAGLIEHLEAPLSQKSLNAILKYWLHILFADEDKSQVVRKEARRLSTRVGRPPHRHRDPQKSQDQPGTIWRLDAPRWRELVPIGDDAAGYLQLLKH
jgi:hypothetical protein